MQKSLCLAWLQRIWTLKSTNEILHLDLERYGGLKMLIHSDYNVGHINIPLFYKDIFVYLKELDIQSRYGGVLWNNKEFVKGGQLFYNKEWHAKGKVYIRDLLGNDNKMLTN